ncbi:MAG: InlB B-repeat-containing protein [Oscillospiraceae bacterium]
MPAAARGIRGPAQDPDLGFKSERCCCWPHMTVVLHHGRRIRLQQGRVGDAPRPETQAPRRILSPGREHPTPSPTPPEESEAPEVHTVNAIAGNGGSISPSGIVEVEDGGSVTFTITADPGYVLSELKVDGYTAELTDSFTFPNVTGEHTIYAIFREEVVETPPPTPTETPVETEDPFWPYITLPPEIDGDEFVTDQPAYPDNSFPSDFFPG